MADKAFFKIVIPNYNGMTYLRQCLDSIAAQTFRDFKVVFVDDLSTDLSMKLAQVYERRYPENFVAVSAGKKRYAGGCRNFGIDYPLDCEYYYFMDSDDYLYGNDALQSVYEELRDRPDVMLLDWYIDVDGIVSLNNFKNFKAYSHRLAQSPWNASWSRFTRSKITEKFLENCMRGEDTYQMLKILDRNPTVKQTSKAIYVYRQTDTSTVHQPIFKRHRPVFMNALRELLGVVSNENVRISILKRLGE